MIQDPAFILCGNGIDRTIAADAMTQYLIERLQIVHLENLRYGVRLESIEAVVTLQAALEGFKVALKEYLSEDISADSLRGRLIRSSLEEYTQSDVDALYARVTDWIKARQAALKLEQSALASGRC